jgi:PIN domain nuclease of toxin-antitoxin system
MRILLDTHALLWYLAGDAQLSAAAQAAIADPAHEVHVSAASAWEILTKHHARDRHGHSRLLGIGPLAVDFTREILASGWHPLDITTQHGQDAGALPWHHKDPFDRILIAQSLGERMPLVSNETLFDAYGVRRIW